MESEHCIALFAQMCATWRRRCPCLVNTTLEGSFINHARKRLYFLDTPFLQTDRAYLSHFLIPLPLLTLYVEAPLQGARSTCRRRLQTAIEAREGGDRVSAISCAEDKQGCQMAGGRIARRSNYRVILVVSELGWVDLNLRCSTILLGQ